MMRNPISSASLFVLFATAFLDASTNAIASDPMLRAGAAKVDVTPRLGVSLDGPISKIGPVTGGNDRLHTRALVFDDGATRAEVKICGKLLNLLALVAPASAFREVRAFPVPEAHQGVAVDADYFYPITNTAVAKYDKRTGEFIQRWESTDQISLKHLNSGVVVEDKLYAAHSTWPSTPPQNSIEIWDTKTMTHIGRKMMDEDELALTWADRHAGAWWVVFAAYGDAASVAKTQLIKFDDNWEPLATWHFPREVIDRFVPYSNSGGSIGPDGLIYATGHDRREVYVLQVPDTGDTLQHVRTLPLAVDGQAIAWDRAQPSLIYGIRRKSKEVVVSQLIGPSEPQ